MIIKKLILNNIRSYEHEEIKFPEGVILLSGNIGSGKSTILLAIEFALFGIKRGEISSSGLLRNGKDSGYVTLNFQVENKNFSVKRTLKRSTNGISQDSSFYTVNDITQELTATELKQRVLEILNYPQESISKKSMIYRYTVYTPQEEMKSILLGEKELRLETLRRVFNIDKYKRIKENCKILISELKIKKKESAAYIYDLEGKKQFLQENLNKIKNLNDQIILVNLKLDKSNESINNAKNEILKIESQIFSLNNLKRDFEVVSSSLRLKNESKIRSKQNHGKLSFEIDNALIFNLELNIEDTKLKISETDLLILNKEKEIKELSKIIVELKSKSSNSEEIKKKIQNLAKCPLCEQEVSEVHKHSIFEREDGKIQGSLVNLNSYLEKEKLLEKELLDSKKLSNELKQKEKEHEINKIKEENLKSKKELLDKIKLELESLESDINLLNSKKADLSLELEKSKDIEEQYAKAKYSLEKLQSEQRSFEIERAKTQQDSINLEKINLQLVKDIEEKQKIKAKLEYYMELQEWLENFFINLNELIERKVMLKIHNEFNTLFQNWFNMLMDLETIKVKLDEEFTPVIEQNGFDTEYENLSGGEKTACALAYRLALNQVINNIVSNVNTKDIIILDEPTDGFSSEQLDRLRLVLQELKMKQIILVSHESKIETFVDNIIRIEKQSHVSQVLNR